MILLQGGRKGAATREITPDWDEAGTELLPPMGPLVIKVLKNLKALP